MTNEKSDRSSARGRCGCLSGLGNLLPATRRARQVLTKFYNADPDYVDTCDVTTSTGKVRGFLTSTGSPITFRGIPYASTARLQPPSPVKPWLGVRECFRWGPACPQSQFGMRFFHKEGLLPAVLEGICPPLPPNKSFWYGELDEERCLNLNVFTPGTDKHRPVLVWIHGGAFMMGSSVEGGIYDANTLAAKLDAVVVTINYRLGAFGFLHFPDEGITNLGIRDQIAALEWVRDNVGNFGGDKANVTVAGESAGGMSVGTLLSSPRARGLFHAAIPMSGACFHAHPPALYSQIHSCVEEALAKDLKATDGKLTAASFTALSEEQVVASTKAWLFKPPLKKLDTPTMLWQPYRGDDIVPIDGAHSNLSGAPPCLVGHMVNEMRLFASWGKKLKTRDQLVQDVIPALRAYFYRTACDGEPSDNLKWTKFTNKMLDAIEAARSKRGLPVGFADLRGAMQNMLTFEDASYCLARDTGCYHYVCWTSSLDGMHGEDIGLLFRGGHPDVKCLLKKPTVGEKARFEDCEQFTNVVKQFMYTKVPSVAGEKWLPFPMSMALKPHPESGPCFTEELQAFQGIKADIMKDLRIDVSLPQVVLG